MKRDKVVGISMTSAHRQKVRVAGAKNFKELKLWLETTMAYNTAHKTMFKMYRFRYIVGYYYARRTLVVGLP